MQLIFHSIRRIILIIEWLLTKALGAIRARIPFLKVKPVVKIFNALNLPHQSSSHTLSHGVWINGRIIHEKKPIPADAKDSKWINFRRLARQWFTREVPNTDMTIRIGGKGHKVQSDKEGYFQLTAHDVTGSIHMSLDEHPFETEIEVEETSVIPQYVIISDVDDTLIETEAKYLPRILKSTLLSNLLTRKLVPGMSKIINDLNAEDMNPVFYITSSPWNLHEFLSRLFKQVKLPAGGIFMPNWGLTPKQWFKSNYFQHQSDTLNKIQNWFPNSKFILFGDDSQGDHHIYAGFIRMYPDTVEAVFIRHVASKQKRKQVEKVIKVLHEEIDKEIMYVISNSKEIRAILG